MEMGRRTMDGWITVAPAGSARSDDGVGAGGPQQLPEVFAVARHDDVVFVCEQRQVGVDDIDRGGLAAQLPDSPGNRGVKAMFVKALE